MRSKMSDYAIAGLTIGLFLKPLGLPDHLTVIAMIIAAIFVPKLLSKEA